MKISNTQAALRKIQERAVLMDRRKFAQSKDWRLMMMIDYGSMSTDVTEFVDIEAIRETVVRAYNKKLSDNATELKELGVYIDTDEAVLPSRYAMI